MVNKIFLINLSNNPCLVIQFLEALNSNSQCFKIINYLEPNASKQSNQTQLFLEHLKKTKTNNCNRTHFSAWDPQKKKKKDEAKLNFLINNFQYYF